MDPVLGLLFLAGCWYALTEAVSHAGRSHRAARSSAARAAGGRGAPPGTAARQEGTAWWFREISRGLPTARHGWARGWRRHKRAMAQRDRDRLEWNTED